ncbi:cysteine proteinase [Rhizophagus clarus]|uniref:ubiquitinyl hydrolase 1 n=1 Tax=Rhizophagus clarus TaxID=94130 RepID=A0A8H3QTQ5_9GLOM|nr:cysteine proteinase [Rhizophagus clarus]
MNIRLEEFLSKDADRSISHKYILFGVLAHSGSFYEGHYFSLLKPEKDGSWFRFDDTCITSVIDDEVFANAYILVYIRESDINEMLSPVALEEIPYHLRCLEEERTLAYQKEKEMLTVKIMTSETFKNYQGFGLANFNEVHVYKILKSETFGVFKENISKVLNIPPKQARFWIFINRPNGTIRPDCIWKYRTNQLMLWLSEENDHLIVFLKYFDPDKQAFEGLGHLYVQKFNKVGDYTQVFCEKKELPPRTPLEIYEEIKPYRIIKMNPEYTFQESDMQDGDIFVSKRIQKHKVARRCWNIPDFHESLIIVSFKPKFKNQEPSLKFDLVLGEKWTYDMIAEAVATRLSVNTFKLRFTTAFSTTGIPKSIIKRSINQTLSDMLKIAYLKPSIYVLYYEILDINIVELETQRSLEVSWLGNTVKEKQVICIHLQKNAIINELLKEILKKVSLSSPNSRIRLFEVRHNKIHKDYTGTESIGSIQEFATLYAEEIPLDEIAINQYDRIFKVCYFTTLCLYGIPFKLVIKNGEKFVDTKVRLQQRLDMNEKGFSKVKFAIIHGTTSYIKPKYFDDENIILSEKKLSNDDYLGLDYTNELVEFEMQNLLI